MSLPVQLRTQVRVRCWTSGVHSCRGQPHPGTSQSTTGAGSPGGTGIPRARGFHGRHASLRAPPPSGTPAARVPSGTGRWKIPLRERRDVSAWRVTSMVSAST